MNRFRYNFFLKPFFLIWDLTAFLIAYILAWCFQSQFFSFKFIQNLFIDDFNNHLIIILVSILLWILLSFILDMQHVPHRKSNGQIFKYFYYPQIIFSLLILLFIIFADFDSLSRLFILYYLITQFFLLLIARIIRITIVRLLRIRGHNKIELGFIGSRKEFDKINDWVENRPWSGIYINKNQYTKSNNTLEDYIQMIRSLKVGDYLIVDKKFLSDSDIYHQLIILSEDIGVAVFEIIDNSYFKESFKRKDITAFGPFWVLKYRSQPLKLAINQINKRIFDFIFSFLFIVLFYWWMHIIISFFIKLTSHGPIFYRQKSF